MGRIAARTASRLFILGIALLGNVRSIPAEDLDRKQAPAAKPSRLEEPGETLAKMTIDALAQSEAKWNADWAKWLEAVKAQDKNFDLFKEARTVEALKKFAEALQKEGKLLAELFLQLGKDSEKVATNLRNAPAYLREAASQYGRWADEVQNPDVAENYRVLRDMWLERAKLIEKRGSDFRKYYDPKLAVFMDDWNTFLGRFVDHLENYYSPIFNTEEHDRFNARLQLYIKQLDRLGEGLKLMREKGLDQAENGAVRASMIESRNGQYRDFLDTHGIPLGMKYEHLRAVERYQRAARVNSQVALGGQRAPVVRLDSAEGRIRHVADFMIVGEPGPGQAGRMLGEAKPGDWVLPAWTVLPERAKDGKIEDVLTDAKALNDSLQTAAITASFEADKREKVRLALAERLRPHAGLLYADYSRTANPPHDIAQVFTSPTFMPFLKVGDELVYYRENDLLDGVLAPAGTAVVIGDGALQGSILLKCRSGSYGDINRYSFGVAVLNEEGRRLVNEAGRKTPEHQTKSVAPALAKRS